MLAKGRHHNKYLQSDWDLYGNRNFRLVAIERAPWHQLNLIETYRSI